MIDPAALPRGIVVPSLRVLTPEDVAHIRSSIAYLNRLAAQFHNPPGPVVAMPEDAAK